MSPPVGPRTSSRGAVREAFHRLLAAMLQRMQPWSCECCLQAATCSFGLMLRINKDGSMPADNPAVWAYGLCNPNEVASHLYAAVSLG